MNTKVFLVFLFCATGLQQVQPCVHVPSLVGKTALVGRALTALLSWRTESELLQAQEDMKTEQERLEALVKDGALSKEEAETKVASLQENLEKLTNALKWSHVLDATLSAGEQGFSSFNSGLERGAGVVGAPALLAAVDKGRIGKKRFLRLFLLATDLALGVLIQKQPLAVREPNRDAVLQSMAKVTTRVRFLKILRRVVRLLYRYYLVGGKSRSARFSLLVEAVGLLGGLRRARPQKVSIFPRGVGGNVEITSHGEELAAERLADTQNGEQVVYFDSTAPLPKNEEERRREKAAREWRQKAEELGRLTTEELGAKIVAASQGEQDLLFDSLLPQTRLDLLKYYYEQDRCALPAFLFGNGDTRGALYSNRLQVTSFKSDDESFFKGESILAEADDECCVCMENKPDTLIVSLKRRGASEPQEHLLQIKNGASIQKSKTLPLNEGETVALQYDMCQHAFCLPCIVSAGFNKLECPLCKAPMNFIYHYPSVHAAE